MKHLIEFYCLMKKENVFRYFNKESVFGWKSHFYSGLPGGSLPPRDPLGPHHHGPVRPGDGGGPPMVAEDPPPRDLCLGRVSRIIYSYF